MVYVLMANGFEEVEALTPVDILRRAGIEVQTVSIEEDEIEVLGAHDIPVTCDIMQDWCFIRDDKLYYKDVDEKDKVVKKAVDLKMLVLPGGQPGTKNLENSDFVQEIVNFCDDNDIFIAAICAAPTILAHKGILDGKNATCFKSCEKELADAILSTEKVVVDGNIITSRSAGTAMDFALELVKILAGEEKYTAVKNSLLI